MERFNKYLLLLIVSARFLINTVQSLEVASLIGGRKVINLKEIKYLVSLQTEDEHFCGGSIIGDKFILTAAHCVINDENEFEGKPIKIVAGTKDLHRRDVNFVVADVEKIYVPDYYNDKEWKTSIPLGDIAVLKLKQSLNLKRNTRLQKLRLPSKRDKDKYETYEGSKVLIAGFGWNKVKVKVHRNKTEYEVGSSSNRLFRASAKVIGNSECQSYYVNPINEGELCARVIEHDDDTPQGVCRGDSGGPLVYKMNKIIGVVNGISIGCNENNEPGIYCRVSSHMNFIRDAMRNVTYRMRVKAFKVA